MEEFLKSGEDENSADSEEAPVREKAELSSALSESLGGAMNVVESYRFDADTVCVRLLDMQKADENKLRETGVKSMIKSDGDLVYLTF